MKNVALILVLALCYSGCQKEELITPPESTPDQVELRASIVKGTHIYTLFYEGFLWRYTLDVPLNYNSSKTYPVLLVLNGKSAKVSRLVKDMHSYINTRQYIGVYPEPKDVEGWNLGLFHTDPLEDVRFMQALIADLETTGKINSNKIYAMGISNGGCMAHYLALKTGIFAAIAPIAGSMYNGIETANVTPVSVLQIHGKLDRSVPYNGGTTHGFNFYSAPNSVKFWALKNGCDIPPALDTTIPGAEVFSYNGCDNGQETILFSAAACGHDIYSSFRNINLKNYIFDFFDRHSK